MRLIIGLPILIVFLSSTLAQAIGTQLIPGESHLLAVNDVIKGVIPGNAFTYGRTDKKPWIEIAPPNASLPIGWRKFVNLSAIDFIITPNPDPIVASFNCTLKFENQSTREFQGSARATLTWTE